MSTAATDAAATAAAAAAAEEDGESKGEDYDEKGPAAPTAKASAAAPDLMRR